MKSATVSVSNTVATLVATSEGGESEVTVSVPAASTVNFGDSAVTTTTGIPVVGASTHTFRIGPDDKLYALASGAGAVNVAVLVAPLGY